MFPSWRRWLRVVVREPWSRLPWSRLRRVPIATRLRVENLEGRLAPAITLSGVPDWFEQGPGPENQGSAVAAPNNAVNGATEVMLAHPTVGNMVFAGTVAGGVWRTNDITGGGNPANINWVPLTDQLDSLYTGAMAFDPSNADTLYVGTGSYSNTFRNQLSENAVGLYRTTNASGGSVTWENLGRATFAGLPIRRVVVSPTNSDQILAASDDGGGNGGLFINVAGTGAQQWTDLTDGAILPNVTASDVVRDPNRTNTYYAALPGAGVYRSDDDGATWNRIDNLNTAITGINVSTNIEIAIHDAGATTVLYVGVVDNNGQLTGVFRYAEDGMDNDGLNGIDDFGESTWAAIGAAPAIHGGGQGFNNFAIAADPVNANLVYVAGDRPPHVFRGDAGAGTWTAIVSTADVGNTRPHADSRDLYFFNNTTLFEADDGGVFQLTNPAAPVAGTDAWTSLNGNLRAIEFHAIAYDTASNLIFGGSQDNGSVLQTATNSLTWNMFQGGDGSTQSYSVPGNIRYSLGNNFTIFTRNGIPLQLRAPAGVANLDGLENTSGAGNDQSFTSGFQSRLIVEANLFNANDVLIGRRALYESTNQGDNITTVVGPTGIAGEKPATERFLGRGVYGGRRAGTNYANIIWVGTEGGRIYLRDETGTFFDRTAALTAEIAGAAAVQDIVADPDDYTRAFALKGDQVAFTTDAGVTWNEITDNVGALTTELRSLAFIDGTPGTAGDGNLVAGGLGGVFRYLASAFSIDCTWTEFGIMPNSLVHDLDFIPIDPDGNAADGVGVILAGSFGRGAWTLADVSALVTATAILQVTGDGNPNAMELRPDPNSVYRIIVDDGAGNVQSLDKGLFQSIQFQGMGGADTFTIADVTLAAGLVIDGGAGADSAGLTNVTISCSAADGFSAADLNTLTIADSVFQDNAGDGIHGVNVGNVVFTNVTAAGNDPGVFLNGAASFADTDGNYSNNNDHGIQLIDILGDVTLVRTRLENNDADDDGAGDGLNATAGVNPAAIGGNVLIRGATIRDTGGASDHQERGVFIESVAATSAITFNDSTGVVQSNTVTGNEAQGVLIQDGGATATFTSGTFSSNVHDNIDIASFSGAVSLSNVTANDSVTEDGLVVDNANIVGIIGGSYSGNGTSNVDNGIQLTNIAAGVAIANATADNNAGDGANIDPTGDIDISNSSFSNNGNDGLELDDVGNVTFTNVTAGDNGDDGFDIDDAGAIMLTDLVLLGNGGLGGIIVTAPSVNYTGSTGAVNDTIQVQATNFQRLTPAQQPIAYSAIGTLTINGDGGSDTINVLGTHAATDYFVNGNAGNDTFNVGSTAANNNGDLDNIAGPLTIVGGDPNPAGSLPCDSDPFGTRDVLYVNDRGDPGQRNYRAGDFTDDATDNPAVTDDLDPVTPARLFAGIFYDGTTEYVRLDGTDDVNIFDVRPSLATQFYIDGNLPPPGTCGGDLLRLDTTGTTGAKIHITAPGSGFWDFTSGHRTVCFESIERFNHVDVLVVANGKGLPLVQVRDAEAPDVLFGQFLAYENFFGQGVRVATGDVNCDGFPDIIVAPGPGRAPTINVYSGTPDADGNYALPLITSFNAFAATFKGGVHVAVGDVNGDNAPDVIAGADAGWLPQIRVFDGEQVATTHALIGVPFQAFPRSFRGGVRVAAGDLDGDNKAEIVAGTGLGTRARVNIFAGADIGVANPAARKSFVPFGRGFKKGVFVAVGDVNGDHVRDVIVSAERGWLPKVKVVSGVNLLTPAAPVHILTFNALPPNHRDGVRVAVKPIAAGDPSVVEQVDIMLASGPGSGIRSRLVYRAHFVGSPTTADLTTLLFAGASFNGIYLA